MMRMIGIVSNKNKPQALALLATIRQYLEKSGRTVLDNLSSSIEDIAKQADLILSIGGDGTLLNLAPYVVDRGTPVLGVHMGNLGFITDVKEVEVFRELDIVLAGRCKVERRFMLAVEIVCGNKKTCYQALNDVVIHREGLSRYLDIALTINGDSIYSVSGDGILVATPTGSTGYNLSAGGPIVVPTAETMIVTPICHHSLIQKSIVLARDDVVDLRISCKSEQERAQVIVDGQTTHVIGETDSMRIVASKKYFNSVRNSQRNYFSVLKEKFRWLP